MSDSKLVYCKPAPRLHCNPKPLKILQYPVERQYTLKKKVADALSPEARKSETMVPVRIMGSPHPDGMYVVAKDVCILLHTRKGNVAKSVAQYSPSQKARMQVLCPRSDGCVSTHTLLVLSVAGVQRLCRGSRCRRKTQVLDWLNAQFELITTEGHQSFKTQGAPTSLVQMDDSQGISDVNKYMVVIRAQQMQIKQQNDRITAQRQRIVQQYEQQARLRLQLKTNDAILLHRSITATVDMDADLHTQSQLQNNAGTGADMDMMTQLQHDGTP